ncbi:imelysin family protein [uncultured Croceitalea sp.]|uniref:imelysin family protein n=1 Tax=uncultured Croceitalea sp. TaxID=1798908 RepID=UPI003306540D
MKRYWYFLIVGFLVLWACSSDGSDETPMTDDDISVTDDDGTPVTFDRNAMLVNWADNIIIPAYEAFEAELVLLNTAFDSFSQDQSEINLQALRSAWLNAYTAWQSISMFEIGPAENIDFRLNMNSYPTNVELIEDFLSGENYDLTLPSNRVVKGFPAFDYLLNGWESSDTARIAVFQNETRGGQVLSYMDDVLGNMTSLTATVVEEWKDNYRDTFISNDGASATASVDLFVNDYIFYFEKFLRAGKMGIPLGIFSGSPLPDRIEAYYQEDVSKELFVAALDAFQNFFNGAAFNGGASGSSLVSYLQDLNTLKDGESLDQLINTQIDVARDAVNGLSTFKEEIEDNDPPTAMRSAYDEVQRLVPLLKVDMVSAMSISIDFVDADGD